MWYTPRGEMVLEHQKRHYRMTYNLMSYCSQFHMYMKLICTKRRENVNTSRNIIQWLTPCIKQCTHAHSSMWYITRGERVLGTLYNDLHPCIKQCTQFHVVCNKRKENVSTSRDIIEWLTGCIKQCTQFHVVHTKRRESVRTSRDIILQIDLQAVSNSAQFHVVCTKRREKY